MNTPTNFERHLDALVPILADVIDHAAKLQGDAQTAVKESRKASGEVKVAAEGLTTTTAGLAKQILDAVTVPFDNSIKNAAETIAGEMTIAKAKAQKAITELESTCEQSSRNIREQTLALESRLVKYVVSALAVGMIVGAAITYTMLHLWR